MMKIYLLIAGITSIMAISACTDLVNSQQTASQPATKISSTNAKLYFTSQTLV